MMVSLALKCTFSKVCLPWQRALAEGWLGLWQGCAVQSRSPLPSWPSACASGAPCYSPILPQAQGLPWSCQHPARDRGQRGQCGGDSEPAEASSQRPSVLVPRPGVAAEPMPSALAVTALCDPSLHHQRGWMCPSGGPYHQCYLSLSMHWAGHWGGISMECCPDGISAPTETAPGANALVFPAQ